MKKHVDIRIALPSDAEAALALYTPYVKETAITFELTPPQLDVFAQRISNTLERYPYLVAEHDGKLLGFAYASPFRPRHAYLHAAETSIYIRKDHRGGGLGRQLYTALASISRVQNVFNMEACRRTSQTRSSDA